MFTHVHFLKLLPSLIVMEVWFRNLPLCGKF